MITSILTDPNATCLTFGCGGVTVPGYQVAVKTGTSEPFDPNGPNGGKYRRDLGLRLHAGLRRRRLGRQLGQCADLKPLQHFDRLSEHA